MTPREQAAWELYCKETAGGLDVRDFWHELSGLVQGYFLTRIDTGQPLAWAAYRQMIPRASGVQMQKCKSIQVDIDYDPHSGDTRISVLDAGD